VYVAGDVQEGVGQPVGDGQVIAAYWVNGVGTMLPMPSGANDSTATGIAVTTH
jgi:hypothetical protein